MQYVRGIILDMNDLQPDSKPEDTEHLCRSDFRPEVQELWDEIDYIAYRPPRRTQYDQILKYVVEPRLQHVGEDK
jgi:hypothetical protein